MKPLTIYARYSSSAQTEQSIEGQLRVCREYAERNGFTVVHEYIDRALTGKTDSRPDFLQMIKDAARGQFQYILVYKLDRFARNKYDSVFYKHKLQKHGVKVISATEAISDTPEGRLLEGILESMAEMYSHDLSQKVKRGMRENSLKGASTGGTILYGYEVIEKRIHANKPNAAVIRYVFEQYANGRGKKEIIEDINAKGFRTKKGALFTINSFYNTLRNRKYIGENRYCGELLEHGYPAIIEKELFEKVQTKLNQNKQTPANGKPKEKYVLHGRAFCGHCGANLIGISGTSKSGKRSRYYACAAQYKQKDVCAKKYEKKDELENFVVKQVLNVLLSPGMVEAIADGVLKMFQNSIGAKRIKEYEKNIARIETEFDKLTTQLLNAKNESIIARINAMADDLEIQKADLKRELAKLKLANAIQRTREDILEWIDVFCQGDELDENYRQRLVNVFVNAVFLFNDKILIYCNALETAKKVEHTDMLSHLTEHEAAEFVSSDNGVLISCDLVDQQGLEPRTDRL